MMASRVGRQLTGILFRRGTGSKFVISGCFPLSSCGYGRSSTWILPRFAFYTSSDEANNDGVLQGYDLEDPDCNVTSNIASRIGINLHLQKNHPLHTIKTTIEDHYMKNDADFVSFDNFSPIVSTQDNFDSLRIPPDHVSRSKSDTYYLNSTTVLRTHTSAHQISLLREGHDRFLVTGDVYRRDEIDSSHYPVFHQMEGVKVFSNEELRNAGASSEVDQIDLVQDDLKHGLEGMARALFGDVEMRWVDAYFPFTDPSLELEIYYNGKWLEVLGCGVIHQDILKHSNRNSESEKGWAFGLGLERLAMVLFSIPDIRLFWSTDERFHNQFVDNKIITFQPYSKYPPCFKDISFWTPNEAFHANDLNEIVRTVAGDLVEKVELIDDFVHPKTKRTSNCFRISYRSMDRSLTNEEIDQLQSRVRQVAVESLGVELR